MQSTTLILRRIAAVASLGDLLAVREEFEEFIDYEYDPAQHKISFEVVEEAFADAVDNYR